METANETGRRKGQDGPKRATARKSRDVKLTLRLTRAERKRIRLYAVECELEPNELARRWFRSRERLEPGPRLATAAGPGGWPMFRSLCGRRSVIAVSPLRFCASFDSLYTICCAGSFSPMLQTRKISAFGMESVASIQDMVF